jgi:flagellar protein FlgJ
MSSVKATSMLPTAPLPGRNGEVGAAELNSVRKEALQKKREEAEKVAQDFETMFIDMMVKSMRQTAQREDVSNAEDIYQGMLDSEYSKSMTATKSFGIRTQILDWLEQTDPELKQFSNDKSSATAETGARADTKIDSKGLLSESMALKAATQAYKMSSIAR